MSGWSGRARGVLFQIMLVATIGLVTLFSTGASAQLIAPTTTTVTASVNPIPFGSSVTFTATVTSAAGTPDGTVLFLSDLISLGSATLNGSGQATFTTTTLPIGVHSIIAVYVGNLNFLTSASIGLNANVTQGVCTLSVAASASVLSYGSPVTLTATVNGGGATPTGNVTFRLGTTVLGTSPLNGAGQAVLSLSSLGVGLLGISADYSGDGSFLGCLAPIITITVNKSVTISTVTSSPNPSGAGAPITFTATVTGIGGTPGGTVTFMDGATTIGSGTLNGSGQATLTTSSLGVGTHIMTASYGGDANFNVSVSLPLTQIVNQGASTTTLASSGNPAAAGTPLTLTASVAAGAGSPTGIVTFRDGATTIGTGTLNGGQAIFVTSALTLGAHSLTAVYGGDSNFAGSTSAPLSQTIAPSVSTTTLTSSANPATAGVPMTLTATVAGSSGTPTGQVAFRDGATTIGTVPVGPTGQAAFLTNSLTPGSHTLTAVYGGDANYGSSASAPLALQVNSSGGTASTTSLAVTPNPAVAGGAVTFTANVSGAGGTPTGTVTFRDGSTTLGSSALNGGGQATMSTSSLATGGHSITAVYAGDSTYAASTSPATALQVNPAGTNGSATSLVSSRNPSIAGQPVTFTARVTGSSGTPGGTVLFNDGGTVIGSATLVSGLATFTTSSLARGRHTITASYVGSPGFAASTSTALTQEVGRPLDSVVLREVQQRVAPIVAQQSGSAISGAIDSAIAEGLADDGQIITPSELGLRLSSAGYDRPRDGRRSSYDEPAEWVVWGDLRRSSLTVEPSKGDISGTQINTLAGVTFRATPDLVVGVLGGYETFNYDVASLSGHFQGGGWTGGGYVGWRILHGLRFDAGVAQTGLDYRVTAGTATASIPASRTFLTTGLTGTYHFLSNVELEPSVRVYALWEKEKAYTDNLGTAQSERNFSTGRASAGAKLTYRWMPWSTLAVAPYAGLYADDYFIKDDAQSVSSAMRPMQGVSARALAGVALTTGYGLRITSGAEVGGLGGNFTSWALRARGAMAF